MEPKKSVEIIAEFIRQKTKGFGGVVIGLSGGIDSTVVAYLAVRALGKDKVRGVCLPYGKQEFKSGRRVAKLLNIPFGLANIKSPCDFFMDYKSSNIQKGNIMARIRMVTLYTIASRENMLVIGTTNKSEYELGYFTKWGDGAVDLEPIADLYKTEVIELAKHLGIPKGYITKKPSADLWEGQTDEKEIGMKYKELDKFLKNIEVKRKFKITNKRQLKILKMIDNSEHKRMEVSKCKLRGV